MMDTEIQENYLTEYKQWSPKEPERPFMAMVLTYMDSLLDNRNYASALTAYFLDIFMGINVRIWRTVDRIVSTELLESLDEEMAISLQPEDLNNVLKPMRETNDRAIKQGLLDATRGVSPYIQLVESPRFSRHIDKDKEDCFRMPGFQNMNIIIDILHVDNNHFQVIKWPPRNQLYYVDRNYEDLMERCNKYMYKAIKTKNKIHQHAFTYDPRALAPLIIHCRVTKSHIHLARELDHHINYYRQRGPHPESLITRHHLHKDMELVASHQSIKPTDDDRSPDLV
jgi:hypothetical protein